MTSSRFSLVVIAALAAVGFSSSTFAVSLPVTPVVAPITGATADGPSTLAFTGLDTSSNVVFQGTETSTVYTNDATNPFGLSGLTFVYQLTSTAGLFDNIERVTVSGFGGFLVNAEYVINPGQDVPDTIDRSSTGKVVGFNFSTLAPGTTTVQLILQTNAIADFPNTMALNDGGNAVVVSFGPAPTGGGGTPEPASLGLMSLGGLSMLRRRRSR